MSTKSFIVTVTYGSDWKTHKDMRRIAKALLRKHIEPEPRYATGKSWRRTTWRTNTRPASDK